MTFNQSPNACDECAEDVTDDDTAPSCGAHRLHIACGPWFFGCQECDTYRAEACS